MLPSVNINRQGFIDSVIRRRRQDLQVFQATTSEAAKLLLTPTRDASVAGPRLREAHHRVGWCLATEFVTQLLGMEMDPMQHVPNHTADGYRLSNEENTAVVALMRGGGPIALGVCETFPKAMFLHDSCPKDLKSGNLVGKRTGLLVDSVINSGKTIVEFVERIHNLGVVKHVLRFLKTP